MNIARNVFAEPTEAVTSSTGAEYRCIPLYMGTQGDTAKATGGRNTLLVNS